MAHARLQRLARRPFALLLLWLVVPTASAQWQSGAAMATPRSEIAAAELNGNLYVAGGIGFLRTLRSCELYTVVADLWQPCPDLPRALHHVDMAADGTKVYAAGGYTSLRFTHDPNPTLFSLAPESTSWDVVAPLPTPIGEHLLVYVNQQLLLIGGRTPDGDSNKVWAFNSQARSWTARAPMPTKRHSSAAVVVDNEVWVLGGRSSTLGSRIKRVEVYNVSRDIWRSELPMPTGRGGHAVAYTPGRIHVIGGEIFSPSSVLDRHDVYDIHAGAWESRNPPAAPRHGGTAVGIGTNIYRLGGGSRPGLQTVFSVTGTLDIWSEPEPSKLGVTPE